MADIYFAGGCFWGVAHFFSGVGGVLSAGSGYAQGSPGFEGRPTYEEVYTDTTGFAETVRVTYRPERISLETLADLYFCIIDPLSLNRQGHDEGTRYRTGIYYSDPSDLPVLQAAFERVSARLGQPLAVELEPLRNFFEAEERHQDYLVKHPDGYCHLPSKVFKYLRLYQDLAALLGDEPDTVARMSESAALIYERMKFFWVGFYRVGPAVSCAATAGAGGAAAGCTAAACATELVLGPFQGPVACLRIGYGRGVCGTAWKEARTVVVPDVEAFPGHIACSSLSKSEIVVPVIHDGAVTAVLDIDSTAPDTFDDTDALWLEKICGLI